MRAGEKKEALNRNKKKEALNRNKKERGVEQKQEERSAEAEKRAEAERRRSSRKDIERDSFAFIISFKSSQKNYGEFVYVEFNF